MTVKEKLIDMLVNSGMSEIQAEDVLELAKPTLEKAGQGYKLTFDRPASEYPSALYPLLFGVIKPVALKWIDDNKPQAWFREMFV